jgi:glycosyltransferase involved in cell wall biosynthesis
MKLLFVIPEYPPYSGGIATFYRQVLPALVELGHQVDVLVGSAFISNQPSYQLDGVNVQFLDSTAVHQNLSRFNRYRAIPEFQRHLAAAWTAWDQVKRGEAYDVVETTDWGMLFVPWIVANDSPPTVVQLHASIGQIDFYDPQLESQLQTSLARLIESNLLALADELQAPSQANANAWKELTGRSVTSIPPALSPTITPRPTTKSANGLVVGRIQYWKGPTILCEALQQLGGNGPLIDWVGRDTPYQESGTSMTAYLEKNYPGIWGKSVRPLGSFSPEETAKLQAAAAFMVVPSIWDVFNYTCVEGMAQGQVVLCSQGAGAADLISHGVNGLTYAANNPQALAETLQTFLSLSESARKQIGEAAQQTVQTKLAPLQVAQQRILAYQDLLQRGKFPMRPNAWLIDAVSPSQPLENPLAFLNYLPLKDLSRYVFQRSFQKLVRSR